MAEFIDLTGKQFGYLTVVKRAPNHGNYAMWECACKCGNTTIVRTSSLKNGHTKSCGCLNKEIVRETFTKHGLYQHRIYSIYQHMIERCYHENVHEYKNYGQRGITVCDSWRNSFEAFSEWAFSNGYSDELTLDRIDVNGNYCPENCRWTTTKIQGNNRRNNRILEFNGESHTMSEWADKLGFSYNLVDSRIFRGWSVERTLTTPCLVNYRRPNVSRRY